jgi:hypothetical protein
MRIRAILIGLLAAMSLTTPVAHASTRFGLADESVTGARTTPTQSADLAAKEGATSSRVTLNWDWVQHTNTTPNFATYDAIYNADLARGIQPVFDLTGAPPWTWALGNVCVPGSNCNFPPATSHDADWQRLAAAIAARYGRVASIRRATRSS